MVIVSIGVQLLGIDVLPESGVEKSSLQVMAEALLDKRLYAVAAVLVKGGSRAQDPDDIPMFSLNGRPGW